MRIENAGEKRDVSVKLPNEYWTLASSCMGARIGGRLILVR